MKCDEPGCTNIKAWGFRDVGFWHGQRKNLCDECYGHRYGENMCRHCEKGCFDEDMEDNGETYLCGRCRRDYYHIEQMISNDLDFWIEQKHADDEIPMEWVEEGWTD